jgi:L-asparaginase II
MHVPEAARLERAGEEPRPIHGNCSGKHAGMLAVCAHEGLDTGGYRNPGHPLQRRILELVVEVCDLRDDEPLVAGDDCGVPTFAMPLKALATGFARLATGEGLSGEVAGAAARLGRAMREHPFLVAGTGRFDTEVMGETDLLCKSGAEGVFAAGSAGGWGLAVKVSDGGGRAVRPAAVAALGRRGVEASGDGVSAKRDLHGELVGEIGPFA